MSCSLRERRAEAAFTMNMVHHQGMEERDGQEFGRSY
jgi:hypothetical protein